LKPSNHASILPHEDRESENDHMNLSTILYQMTTTAQCTGLREKNKNLSKYKGEEKKKRNDQT